MAVHSANTSSLNETEIPSWIRGYHVYQDTWEIEIGEVLDLIHEPNNSLSIRRFWGKGEKWKRKSKI